jgi:predicted GTPase
MMCIPYVLTVVAVIGKPNDHHKATGDRLLDSTEVLVHTLNLTAITRDAT